MFTEEQVRALELKGLTYWQCEGKDYALDLKTILDKKEKLLEQGIQVLNASGNVIRLVPASWCKPGTVAVDVCNTIPLDIDTQTSTIVDNYSWGNSLCSNFITLDLSKTYIRQTDIKTINRLAKHSQHVILSNSLDKPGITSLTGLFRGSEAEDVNFTDFRGLYVKNVDHMFARSKVQNITWDYVDFSGVESAIGMFWGADIKNVNLGTFPMMSFEAMSGIFLSSNLTYPYSESLLASGELQKMCRKTYGCLYTAVQRSSSISLYVIKEDFWDNFLRVVVKDDLYFKMSEDTVIVYSKDGIDVDDLFKVFLKIDYDVIARFLFWIKPRVVVPDDVSLEKYTDEFVYLLMQVYDKE